MGRNSASTFGSAQLLKGAAVVGPAEWFGVVVVVADGDGDTGVVGAVMLRERRGLALVSFALAAAAILDGTAHLFTLSPVSDAALSAYLLLAPA